MKIVNGMIALPALVAAAACAPPPASGLDGAYREGQIQADACWIEFVETPSGALLAEAYAAPGLSGSYELSVYQASSGGEAVIEQSGPFEALGSEPALIHQITLGGAAPRRGASLSEMMASMRNAPEGTTIISSGDGGNARYDVRLRLLDGDGRQICTADLTGP